MHIFKEPIVEIVYPVLQRVQIYSPETIACVVQFKIYLPQIRVNVPELFQVIGVESPLHDEHL